MSDQPEHRPRDDPGPADLVVRPLTSELWPALEDLLDQGGPAGRCWCMATRIGAAYRRRPADDNRADFWPSSPSRRSGTGVGPGQRSTRCITHRGRCPL
jgi:hypothetical protein